jgi:hypothetical protein
MMGLTFSARSQHKSILGRYRALSCLNDVISANRRQAVVLEMGEDKRRAGDVADSAGAEGDVLEGSPAAFEQSESAFAEATQGA